MSEKRDYRARIKNKIFSFVGVYLLLLGFYLLFLNDYRKLNLSENEEVFIPKQFLSNSNFFILILLTPFIAYLIHLLFKKTTSDKLKEELSKENELLAFLFYIKYLAKRYANLTGLLFLFFFFFSVSAEISLFIVNTNIEKISVSVFLMIGGLIFILLLIPLFSQLIVGIFGYSNSLLLNNKDVIFENYIQETRLYFYLAKEKIEKDENWGKEFLSGLILLDKAFNNGFNASLEVIEKSKDIFEVLPGLFEKKHSQIVENYLIEIIKNIENQEYIDIIYELSELNNEDQFNCFSEIEWKVPTFSSVIENNSGIITVFGSIISAMIASLFRKFSGVFENQAILFSIIFLLLFFGFFGFFLKAYPFIEELDDKREKILRNKANSKTPTMFLFDKSIGQFLKLIN